MEKKVLFWLAAAVALTSCSNEEVMEQNFGDEIKLRAAVSRATSTTTANLTDFYVTAFEVPADAEGINRENETLYFKDAHFTKIGNEFTSTPKYYWPTNNHLHIYCYAPSATELGGVWDYSDNTPALKGLKPESKIGNQKDFIVYEMPFATKEFGTNLEFYHLLSQIEIKAKNDNEAYTYTVKGVKIANVIGKTDFILGNFENQGFILSEEKATYIIDYDDNEITLGTSAVNLMHNEGNAFLIPQNLKAYDKDTNPDGAYIAVKIKVEAAGHQLFPKTEGKYAWVAVPINQQWLQGNKLVYTLDFTSGAGINDPGADPSTDSELDPEPGPAGESVLGDPITLTATVDDSYGYNPTEKNLKMAN